MSNRTFALLHGGEKAKQFARRVESDPLPPPLPLISIGVSHKIFGKNFIHDKIFHMN